MSDDLEGFGACPEEVDTLRQMTDVEPNSVCSGFGGEYFTSRHVEYLNVVVVAVADGEPVVGRVGVSG